MCVYGQVLFMYLQVICDNIFCVPIDTSRWYTDLIFMSMG